MKKILPLLMFSVISVLSSRADLIWYEGFNYADGPINVTGTNIDGSTNWFLINGNSDAMVANHVLENAASGAGTTLNRSGDNSRPLCTDSCSYTSAPTVLYFSFTVNSTNFPDADGGYFAHLSTNSTTFQCKVFALKSPGLPNTWQLGVSGALSANATAVFPADLATNVDYQVVVEWDPVSLYAASLWVNPISSADPRVTSNDGITPFTAGFFNFRQPSGMGDWFCTITNLAIATTFEEAATNVWSTNAAAPVMAYDLQGGTNFVGEVVVLSAVAAGQGQGSMVYDWYKNGILLGNPNGNTNAFTLFSALTSDSGNYRMVATTPYGLSVTSSVASLWVTNPPVPPTFTQQPSNTTVYFGQTATLKAIAAGVQPITYQWYFTNGTAVAGANFSGETTDTLSITDVRANNGTAVAYYCVASNPFGGRTSSTGVVFAVSAPVATIGELRTMVDSTFFLPTNTTALWTVTGLVTTYTNMTTAANSSFYMQDSSGGINVFFAGNTAARPQAGDSVTVVGPLGQFNSLLELNLTAADPAHSVITNSSGNPLPAAAALPFSFTNSPSASNAIRFYQSALVTLTNVYFPPGFTGTNNFGSGVNVVVTNAAGETLNVRIDSRVGDIIGRRVPPYGWTVTGPMGFFLGTTAPNRSAGFQLLPTRFADIVSQMPASVTYTGGNPILSWMAGPKVSYSVWRADDVESAYTPIATGLVFGTAAGTYTDTTAPAGDAFYKITSP